MKINFKNTPFKETKGQKYVRGYDEPFAVVGNDLYVRHSNMVYIGNTPVKKHVQVKDFVGSSIQEMREFLELHTTKISPAFGTYAYFHADPEDFSNTVDVVEITGRDGRRTKLSENIWAYHGWDSILYKLAQMKLISVYKQPNWLKDVQEVADGTS